MPTVLAPAKINIVLEVLGKYDDYHQISSIVQPINLCDTLNFELAEEISFTCSEPVLERDNLVTEAAILLRKVTKCSQGARIKLYKHIPWGVGLGGGSSDAATTLFALNRIWGLGLSTPELADLAFELGSDVPFFVYGSTALVQERGEKVTPLPSLPSAWFVLLVPSLPKIPNKTKQLYGELNISHYTKGEFVDAALPYLLRGEAIDPALMFNAFEKVTFDVFPQLEHYKEVFEEAGANNVHLVGSGPALFTLVYKEEEASSLCWHLQKQGLECYMVSSFTSKAV